MYLATTANPEWWDPTRRVVFLSSWCLRPDRAQLWQNLDYQVLPNPWNDRERVREAREYLDRLNENSLSSISACLNNVHGTNYGTRYWRILIGPWLDWYLCIYYDRYVHVREALRQYGNLDTWVLPTEAFVTPKDTHHIHDLVVGDMYNLQLASQLLGDFGLSFSTIPNASADASARVHAEGPPSQDRSEGGELLSSKRLPLVMIHEMYCPAAAENRLLDALRPIGCRFPLAPIQTELQPGPIMSDERMLLAGLPAHDEFESLFAKSLVSNFPILWMEGYRRARAAVTQSSAALPSVIVSANAWYYNEAFKFFVAHASLHGTRLVSVQHGGGYGVDRVSFNEGHERRICDRFLGWGWAEPHQTDLRNVPALQIPELEERVHRERSTAGTPDGILFFATDFPPTLNGFRNQPILDQWNQYFEWEFRFLQELDPNLRKYAMYRPYTHDYGRGTKNELAARFPWVVIDDGRNWAESWVRRIAWARLVVIDHKATTFLYTLALNVPTVLYWNPDLWELRPEAQLFFEELRRVKILWNDPESAAAFVSTVYGRVKEWWDSSEVQAVRQSFVLRHALNSDGWLSEWKEILLDELKGAEAPHDKSRASRWREGTEPRIPKEQDSRLFGLKWQCFELTQDSSSHQSVPGARETAEGRPRLQSALSRLNTRLQR